MPSVNLPNNWQPRSYQMPLWTFLERGGKRAIEVAHRRWGKDDVCLHRAAIAAHERPATYWHMLPVATQARKAIWDAVNPHTGKKRIDEAFPYEVRSFTRDNEMIIGFQSGSTWQVLGSDNYNNFIGSPPAGVVFSEWALANPSSWAYTRPILKENNGWALFITTPRGKNHAYTMLRAAEKNPNWYAGLSPATQTDVFTPAQLEEELKEYTAEYGPEMGRALFEQEYLCSFEAAIIGSVYGAALARLQQGGRLRPNLYDPSLKVHTAWDLGYDDTTAIWFWQQAGREVRWIDYYENSGLDPRQCAEQVLGMEINEVILNGKAQYTFGKNIDGLEHRRDYNYGHHFLPHDAANKLQAAGGRSIVQQLHAMGLQTRIVAATSQQNGITALRKVLEVSYFDVNVEEAFEKLKLYHFPWDDDLKILRSTPLHDESSHCADAAEIVGQVLRSGEKLDTVPERKLIQTAQFKDIMRLNDYGSSNSYQRI